MLSISMNSATLRITPLDTIMPNVANKPNILSFVMLSVIMLNVIMLSAIMLSVVALGISAYLY
jgi:hypothetical protein